MPQANQPDVIRLDADEVERFDVIRKVGDEYCVFSKDGRRLGCHATPEAAARQLAAVEASKDDGGDNDVTRFDDDPESVVRYDVSRITRVSRTPGGGIRVEGNLSRTGVQKYTREDGTVVREYRPPSEVFHPDSLASFQAAPVTDLHPPEMVTAKNWKKYTRGHIADGVGHDDRFVKGDLVIGDGDVIASVDNGDRKEISTGYRARLDETPGVTPEGEAYDAVQRRIRVNHVAIGPEKWARGGSEVAMRLDASGHELFERKEERTMAKIKIDGIDYEAGSEAAAQAMAKFVAKAEQERADAVKASEATQGKLDAVTKERDETKGKLDAASDPETLRKAVDEEVSFRADLVKVMGEEEAAKLDGKTRRERMEAGIRHGNKDADLKDRSDEYVGGHFEAVVGSAPSKSAASLAAATKAGGGPPVVKTDDLDEDGVKRIDSEGARKRALKESAEAWEKPLAASVDRVVTERSN